AEEALKKKKKASGMLLAAPAAMEEEDNGFVSKLKKAMADKYEEYGEAVADKYNKASDWADLLAEEQKRKRQQTQKEFDMKELSPEYEQLIEDMSMSSPAIGIGKAVKATPELLKQLLKK
ncbi:hypothetical protein, partial [Pseudomonas aeruginosa]|uniref:hypothetical protein n=1 Tax=Pseudomonas aeruginosa TaxID=287 RepID=UPI002095C0CB